MDVEQFERDKKSMRHKLERYPRIKSLVKASRQEGSNANAGAVSRTQRASTPPSKKHHKIDIRTVHVVANQCLKCILPLSSIPITEKRGLAATGLFGNPPTAVSREPRGHDGREQLHEHPQRETVLFSFPAHGVVLVALHLRRNVTLQTFRTQPTHSSCCVSAKLHVNKASLRKPCWRLHTSCCFQREVHLSHDVVEMTGHLLGCQKK